MLTLANIPDFHPRSKNAGKPDFDGRVNVNDPDRLVMGPAEYAAFSEGCTYQSGKVAVRSSDHGPGVLEIMKVTFKNGQYKILPYFTPNSFRGRPGGPWLSCSSLDLGWPFVDSKAAMKAMAKEYNITFKQASLNE